MNGKPRLTSPVIAPKITPSVVKIAVPIKCKEKKCWECKQIYYESGKVFCMAFGLCELQNHPMTSYVIRCRQCLDAEIN